MADEVDEKTLQAAFIPFGDIVDVQLPLDFASGIWNLDFNMQKHPNHKLKSSGKHRGFAFIEYELHDDAMAAIDNMVRDLFESAIKSNKKMKSNLCPYRMSRKSMVKQ